MRGGKVRGMSVEAGDRIGQIARMCHEANRAWCEMHGDTSQWAWIHAPSWTRESARAGVEFALANPDAPDSAQHDQWMTSRLADGWTYGPVKDTVARTHPCLVPFGDLPVQQQVKDRLFRAIVKALA